MFRVWTGSFLACFLQLIVLLNPECDCCSGFVLSWVGRFTTGTQSFVLVIRNVPCTYWIDNETLCWLVRWRIISELIKGISRVSLKVTQIFQWHDISTSFVLPSAVILTVIPALTLNDSESLMLSFGIVCYLELLSSIEL